MSQNDKLTAQQQRFVDEYLADPDLGQGEAARRAGYADSGADVEASRLLRNPKIREAIDAACAARARRTRITHDRVLREIASLAFSNINDYVVDDEGNISLRGGADSRALKAISSIKRTTTKIADDIDRVVVELKLWDKPKALDQLARHLNLFKEDQEAGAPKVAAFTPELMEQAQKFLRGEEE